MCCTVMCCTALHVDMYRHALSTYTCTVINSALQSYSILHSDQLWYTVLHCTVRALNGSSMCCTVLYCTVLICVVLYYTVLYCIVLFCVVLYYTVSCVTYYCTVLHVQSTYTCTDTYRACTRTNSRTYVFLPVYFFKS
jgi:hypothetical protein